MASPTRNPSSIYSCLKGARENAHAVRWQITSETWETLNATWLAMRAIPRSRVTGAGAMQFFDWVKDRSHLFRGVTYGTIVRGEAFNFSRLGTFLERADNTARILDVKYHILLPSVEDVGGALDYYQWAALLRSVSSFESYRALYRDQIFPIKVAQLLILERRMPRSLAPAERNQEALDSTAARTTRRQADPCELRHGYATDVDEISREGSARVYDRVLGSINELGSRRSALTGSGMDTE